MWIVLAPFCDKSCVNDRGCSSGNKATEDEKLQVGRKNKLHFYLKESPSKATFLGHKTNKLLEHCET